jgi:hypothetical protein
MEKISASNLDPEGIEPVSRLIPDDTGCASLIGSMKGNVKVSGDVFSTGIRWNAES